VSKGIAGWVKYGRIKGKKPPRGGAHKLNNPANELSCSGTRGAGGVPEHTGGGEKKGGTVKTLLGKQPKITDNQGAKTNKGNPTIHG